MNKHVYKISKINPAIENKYNTISSTDFCSIL